MFENAPIGVNDKNGKPIKNGDKVKTDIRGNDRLFRVIWYQEECSFKLQRLNISYNHSESILNYILSSFYEIVEEN